MLDSTRDFWAEPDDTPIDPPIPDPQRGPGPADDLAMELHAYSLDHDFFPIAYRTTEGNRSIFHQDYHFVGLAYQTNADIQEMRLLYRFSGNYGFFSYVFQSDNIVDNRSIIITFLGLKVAEWYNDNQTHNGSVRTFYSDTAFSNTRIRYCADLTWGPSDITPSLLTERNQHMTIDNFPSYFQTVAKRPTSTCCIM